MFSAANHLAPSTNTCVQTVPNYIFSANNPVSAITMNRFTTSDLAPSVLNLFPSVLNFYPSVLNLFAAVLDLFPGIYDFFSNAYDLLPSASKNHATMSEFVPSAPDLF